MATRFEYDVISLKVEHDDRDRRCFKWRSRRGGCHDVGHSELEEMLNRLGAEGWHVVSHDTDAAYGSTLILQRAIEEGASAPSGRRARAIVTPEATAAAERVVGELQALRADLASQPAPGPDPALLAAIGDLRSVLERPVAPITATLDPAVTARLEVLAQRPDPVFPPVQAVVDPQALAALEETVRLACQQAVRAPATVVFDPATTQWFEETFSRRDDDPPAGPPIAVLGEDAVAQLSQALGRAMPQPTVLAPTAMLDEASVSLLTQAIAGIPRPSAALTHASVIQLERAIHRAMAQATERPATALLTPELVTQLEGALARLPTPTLEASVQATATLDAEAIAELRSVLAEVAACAQAPVTVESHVDVAPIVAAIAPLLSELKSVRATPIEAHVSEAALARIEAAVRQVVQAVEIAQAPRLIEPMKESKPERSWRSWFTFRPRLATR